VALDDVEKEWPFKERKVRFPEAEEQLNDLD